jgi:tripartite-type tricarboxylate transporter receptor subunit TctC
MRTSLLILLSCATGAVHAQQASTQRASTYPNKPLRIIVTVPAGGSVDGVTRAMGQKLSEKVGVPVVVDNRAGGTGAVAMNLTRQSAPDGHTVMSASNSMVVTGVLGKVPYDIRTALEPVVQMTSGAYVVTINPTLSVASLKDLIALAKAKPDSLSYGTPGIGSIIHLSTEQLAYTAGGLRMVHVPYKGNSFAIVDLIAGRLDVLLAAAGVATHIRSGKLKALAVTSRRRTQAFPELPTLAEAGLPGVVLENAYGLYAPAGVRPDIVAALNREVTIAMNSPEARARVTADGAEPTPPHTPAEFKASYLQQYEQWERIIKSSGIKLE